MIRGLLIIFLTVVTPFFAWAQGLKCVDILNGSARIPDKIKALESLLSPTTSNPKVQTVFYRGETSEEQIILHKPDPRSSWFTSYDPYTSGGTLHGDPRNAIAVLGAPLAAKMGFEVIKNADGSTTLLAPTARRTAKFIKKVNKTLIARGQEPITYLPVGAGFVNDKTIVEMSAKENKDGFVFFPFADQDTKLGVHEVSYHQFPIIYPKEFNDRAKRISLRYVQLIQLIESSGGELQSVREDIIALIRNSRSIEIDYGYANTGALLAERRMQNQSYAEMASEKFSGESVSEIAYFLDHIQFTLQPNRSPALAVAGRMIEMFGLKGLNQEFFGTHRTLSFPSFTDETMRLTETQKTALASVVRTFLKMHLAQDQADFKAIDTFSFRAEMLKRLDRRIEEINSAAEE